MPTDDRRQIQTADGRSIHYHATGEPGRPLVIAHHGTPGAGVLADRWHEDAEMRSIRLVSYSRPGYAGSARVPGRAVSAAAADAAAVADAEGAEHFSTWGLSGGGPHALACAALLPERVLRAATVAGVAPYGVEDLEWMEGMGEENVVEFGAALRGEGSLRELLTPISAAMRDAEPAQIKAEMSTLLPLSDIAALDAGLDRYLSDSFRQGLAGGPDGWIDDDLAFTREWGFDLAAMSVPVLVAQGSEDLMVPQTHGRWLAGHVRGAEVLAVQGLGHVALLDRMDDVYDWLLAD